MNLEPAPAPRLAATVLLLRDTNEGPAVYMVQRSAGSTFMPGAWVFPGGKVDHGDEAEHCADDVVAAVFGGAPPARARALMAAAAREVNEEVGVELTEPSDLRAWARWVTPPIETRRFDTWFFVVRAPRGAEPQLDSFECEDGRWVLIREAQQEHEAGRLVLAPPTYVTLLELAPHDDAGAVLSACALRSLDPIEPRFVEADGLPALILPGDPDHDDPRRLAGPTRLVMDGGRWWSVGAGTRTTPP